MFSKLLKTDNDWTLTFLRLVFGVVFFAHGAQKTLGWFGGRGFAGYMTYLEQIRHVPAFFTFLAIIAELCGSFGLILGFLSRIAAFGIAVNMILAIALVHIHFGFFMNWNTTKRGEGFEFCLLAILLAVFVTCNGSGAFSLDSFLHSRFRKLQPNPGSPHLWQRHALRIE